VVVVGAGAFGGWTALMLRRRGFEVTLVDAWGPGNSRASSGGDTRVIRGMYGPDQIYTGWVVRAFEVWQHEAARWGVDLYHPTGALWMFRGDDGYAQRSLPYLRDAGLKVDSLPVPEADRRWPQINFDGIQSVYFEQRAGYLRARDACRAVTHALVAEGGEFLLTEVRPQPTGAKRLEAIQVSSGAELKADHFVFACGPWLGSMFPEAIGRGIKPTRQEVFYFGPPPSPSPWQEGTMPTWIDFGERIFYGIPGNLHRGFKVADDTHGEPVDPSTQERRASDAGLQRARQQLRERFPALADAPLLESRVCQYENTPDGHYLIDRHPKHDNVWLVGGGSGHGFKLGPAVGEHVADLVAGKAEPMPRFALSRLAELDAANDRSQLKSGS
jgi:glycine/D-amino acid oxidase-like deaminating enzyme